MPYKHKIIVKNAIVIGALLLSISIVAALIRNEFIAEYIFARGISRYYIAAVGYLTSAFRFSVFEVLIAVAVSFLIIAVIYIIIKLKRRHFDKAFLCFEKIVIAILSISFIYIISATPSYYRADISSHLPLLEDNLTDDELTGAAKYFLDDFNTLAEKFSRDADGGLIAPYSVKVLADKMKEEFKRLDDPYFSKFIPTAKPVISSLAMSSFGIIGVSFQPTGETNYNRNTAAIDFPSLIAHELAHSIGVMREGDAELIASYITLSSKDDYIRYSGYHNFFRYITNGLYVQGLRDTAKKFNDELNPRIIRERELAFNEYNKYSSFITHIGEFFNDLYLKINGASNGTGSYTDWSGTDVIEKPDGSVETVVRYSPILRAALEIYSLKAEAGA